MCALQYIHTDLNFDEVDWLQDTRGGCQHAGIEDATCGRNDLASSSVDGVGMERDVVDVEPDSANVLLTHYSLDEERERRERGERDEVRKRKTWGKVVESGETTKAKQLHTRERER